MDTQRRALLYIACFLAFPIAYISLIIAFSFYFESVEGDLTRLGNWAERDFGPRAPQPDVTVKYNGEGIKHPDVLVLGDSFSRSNYWQSYVAQMRGVEILSFHYQDVGCLDNWLRWVMNERASS